AIRSLRVRGAPAIGITAAMGVLVGLKNIPSGTSIKKHYEDTDNYLRTSRPTAVNLFWALDRMKRKFIEIAELPDQRNILSILLEEALLIEKEDRAMCQSIGKIGANLVQDGFGILTHCNTGGLATAAYGTALSVIFTAYEQGKSIHVFCDETRPLMQGARLTSWELLQAGIPATLICDSMAAQVMKEGKINMVIVGADRIAANGDSANKIGTYGLSVLAHAHKIPFYVAAPSSTFDLTLKDGSGIPIEQRNPKEITEPFGKQVAPTGVSVYNPAFDVSPAHLITGIITEKSLISPVNAKNIKNSL
ncbi:S-methyl-5-thioribose-1-phosphate isomerase, partial [bacterium]|nr:S-methyl-5-thioribose-1-phosphate isomerase [bacterium]